MKKPTPKARHWHHVRAASELQKRIKLSLKFSRKLRPKNFKCVIAPDSIGLDVTKSRKNTLAFIENIKNLVRKGERRIYLDFGSTRKFIAGGTILILAELTRLRHLYPDIKIRGLCPRNPKAAQVIKQVGISRLCGISVKEKVKDEDVVSWRMASGQGALGKKFDKILGTYDGIIAEALSDNLYRGVTEAMTNANHHAYFLPRGDGLKHDPEHKPWWMFSQERDGMLFVVFCDLGLGIPATLPTKQRKWWSYAQRFNINAQGDGRLIQGAVRNSQSRTRKLFRGKGLRQIVDTVNSTKEGEVHIFSNYGWYASKAQDDLTAKPNEYTRDFDRSIMGTVIQWSMPLPKRVAK